MKPETAQSIELHAIVKGRVQGVGFRAFTRYHALSLDLKGVARNLPDGSVEIIAQGSKHSLEALVSRLQEESREEQITEMLIDYRDVGMVMTDFLIR